LAGASGGGPARQKKRRATRGRTRKYLLSSAVGLLAFAGGLRAQVPAVNAGPQQPVSATPTANSLQPDAAGVRLILEGPPGAGGEAATASPAPSGAEQSKDSKDGKDGKDAKDAKAPSFNAGYDPAKGFFIDALRDPDYPKTCDNKFPFELQFRGRIQSDYYNYKVTDSKNHLTGLDTGANTAPDESLFEVKRVRLIFAGWIYDPNIRYLIQLDANTRGLATEDTRQNAFNNPIGNIEGGANISNVDAGARLFEAWVAYDIHGDADCNGYRPTLTFIAGKLKPMGSFEEYLGSANEQFVEYGMSSWMFDSDADNLMYGAGIQVHAMEDRFYAMALITNGSDNQVPDYNLDYIPGANLGFWYDFGGTWDPEKNRWKLYGNYISDLDWSENPVVRVGSAANLTPMARRSQYTSAELDFYRAATAAPGGSNLDTVLGGGGLGTGGNFTNVASGQSPFAVDAFDAYTFDFFAAGKWHGFSLYNEWWVRDFDNFRGEKTPSQAFNNPILYTMNTPNGKTATALFNRGGMVDYGMALQSGYFLIPHRLEVAARYDFINGVSGDINGDGTFSTVTAASLGIKEAAPVAGVQPPNTVPKGTMIRIVNGAFTHDHYSQEIAAGLNVYFYGQQVKWQTDVGFYTGGNPAANGQSPAGYIPGVNGYEIRTQVQLFF
jgi:hypothetical protein